MGTPDVIPATMSSASMLRGKISTVVASRDYPKTCCPSEVARRLSNEELAGLDCGSWRDTMPLIREEAWRMRAEGLLDITQGGEAIAEETESLQSLKGPIRLRAKPVK